MKQGEKMLKKLTQQATDLILHSIASGEVMGANFLITKGNEELVYAQAGMADREAEKPIERNTIFRLYSMTKPITAVAAMILMERGMLDLYEPVADILPAFAHQKVERDGKRVLSKKHVHLLEHCRKFQITSRKFLHRLLILNS